MSKEKQVLYIKDILNGLHSVSNEIIIIKKTSALPPTWCQLYLWLIETETILEEISKEVSG